MAGFEEESLVAGIHINQTGMEESENQIIT